MNTHWAIDGYNLLFACRIEDGTEPDFEKQREALLGRIRRLKDPATVFFDAAKAPPGLTRSPEGRGKLAIVYVREGTADDAIVNWLKGQQRPNEVRVVTNDRELGGRVRGLHGKVASVEEFLKSVDPEQLEGKEKPRITSSEARKWAEEFGVDPDAKV
ncbi:MAG: NYN domain-containing protein [Planctomycetes bacterium]|nr:NYN domain-containing protein [Planctomycetota bacterium]